MIFLLKERRWLVGKSCSCEQSCLDSGLFSLTSRLLSWGFEHSKEQQVKCCCIEIFQWNTTSLSMVLSEITDPSHTTSNLFTFPLFPAFSLILSCTNHCSAQSAFDYSILSMQCQAQFSMLLNGQKEVREPPKCTEFPGSHLEWKRNNTYYSKAIVADTQDTQFPFQEQSKCLRRSMAKWRAARSCPAMEIQAVGRQRSSPEHCTDTNGSPRAPLFLWSFPRHTVRKSI